MTDPLTLKRSLSLPLFTFYGLGTILGAGIYVLVGKVAVHAGAFVPVAFLIAALLTACTALSYAELAARHPKSGGAAVYVRAGFQHRWLGMFAGFLMIFTGMVSSVTLVNGFVGYLHVFTVTPAWLVIALLVLGMGALAACMERHLPGRISRVLRLPRLRGQVNVAEETKEPTHTVPRAILLALGIATLLYLLAVVDGALIQIIMAARILYGMSREGWLHMALGQVHAKRRTPLLATALVTLTVLALALWLPLVTLAKATSFVTLVAFSFINLALLRIKRRTPTAQASRVYPAWVSPIGFLTSFSFVLFQTADYVSH